MYIVEQPVQFFFFQFVFIDMDRKTFEILFPESPGFSGMGRDENLGHFRFFRIIREELRLVEDFKEGQLVHLIRLFRLTAEGTLVHKSDLLRKELQLGTDGNEDMFVHLIELFFGKTGEICHAAPRFVSASIITEML